MAREDSMKAEVIRLQEDRRNILLNQEVDITCPCTLYIHIMNQSTYSNDPSMCVLARYRQGR